MDVQPQSPTAAQLINRANQPAQTTPTQPGAPRAGAGANPFANPFAMASNQFAPAAVQPPAMPAILLANPPAAQVQAGSPRTPVNQIVPVNPFGPGGDPLSESPVYVPPVISPNVQSPN